MKRSLRSKFWTKTNRNCDLHWTQAKWGHGNGIWKQVLCIVQNLPCRSSATALTTLMLHSIPSRNTYILKIRKWFVKCLKNLESLDASTNLNIGLLASTVPVAGSKYAVASCTTQKESQLECAALSRTSRVARTQTKNLSFDVSQSTLALKPCLQFS